MAIALSHPAVMNLTGPQLAAYIGALVCSDVIRRPMTVWTSYQVCQIGAQSLVALPRARCVSVRAARTCVHAHMRSPPRTIQTGVPGGAGRNRGA